MWVAFAGAIFLPYFAVVIANSPGKTKASSTIVAPKLTISNDQFKVVDDK
jgi:hypothetical protein